jgi:hypothetical protein
MSQQVLEGTWEEVLQHADELSGKRVRLTVLSETSHELGKELQEDQQAAIRAVRGKYAHVRTSVDEFLTGKREEVELEEQRYQERHRGEQKE